MNARGDRHADERLRLRFALTAAFAVSLCGTLLSFPGLAPLDAGDFVTAAATFGVPHATGFPVYLEGARWLGWLPVGNLASRMAWFSALASGVAAGCLAWVAASALRLRYGAAAVAVAAALAFLRVDTLALHARVPEVYALNIALVGVALVGVERLATTGDARWRGVVALAAGLGLANHALFRLWTPLLVVAVAAATPSPARRRGWGGLLGVGLLALTAYLALWVAASGQPAHNWGDPSTLDRLWAHVTARDIRIAFADQMRPTAYSFGVWSRILADQLFAGLGVAVLLGVGGAVVALRRRSTAGVLLALLALVEWGYATVLNPMGLRDFQNGQLLAVSLAVFAGALVGAATERALNGRRGPGAVVALAIALGIATFLGGAGMTLGPTEDDWSAEDVAAAHLGLAEPASVTVAGSDTTTAALLYACDVLDARPDALAFGSHVLTDGRAAAYMARRSPFDLAPAEVVDAWEGQGQGPGGARTEAVLQQVGRRAVYWEASGNGDGLPPTLRLVHVWPIGHVVSASSTEDECAAADRSLCVPTADVAWGAAARARAGAEGSFYGDWMARRWGYRGTRAFRAGRFDESGMWFERAVRLSPTNATWLTGLAVALANTGRLDEALRVELLAVERNPMSSRALANALSFAEALGDSDTVARLRRLAARQGAEE